MTPVDDDSTQEEQTMKRIALAIVLSVIAGIAGVQALVDPAVRSSFSGLGLDIASRE